MSDKFYCEAVLWGCYCFVDWLFRVYSRFLEKLGQKKQSHNTVRHRDPDPSLGSLSKGVFERRTSTGSGVVLILKHLYAPKFVFLSVLTIIETCFPKRWAKPLSKNEKRPLPVDVRRSKTSLLKFTIG